MRNSQPVITHGARLGRATSAKGRTKTPRKTPKANLLRIASWPAPSCWLAEYFGPLERFAEQIQKEGTVDVSASGIPLHFLPDGRVYYPVAKMWAMAEVFGIAQLRDASCPSKGPIVRVAIKLNTGQLLTSEDVVDLCYSLRELRAYAGSLARSSMIDLIRTARIKLELGRADYSHTHTLAYGET